MVPPISQVRRACMTTQQEIYAEIERIGTISSSSDSGLETALQRIAGLAGKSHPQVADIAASLLREISDENSGPPDQSVKSGLEQLQAAMQSFTEESSAEAAESALADDPELIHDFVVESREHISSIETNLLALEKDALLLDAVHGVFRSFHTIKGLAGFLGFGPLQEVAHETETLLDHAREKRVEMTPHLIDVTLKAADYIRNGVDFLSAKPVHEAMQSLAPWRDLRDEIASASEKALTGGGVAPELSSDS